MHTHRSLDSILEAHEAVFKPELGTLRGMEAKLHVEAEAQPLFFRARTVPFALRQKVEQELERLEQEGVVEPVTFSDWAAPIVPVMKGDGGVRICGDYKLTVNKVAKLEVYPLPRIDELFASLSGGQTFSKLDLSHVPSVRDREHSQRLVQVQKIAIRCCIRSGNFSADHGDTSSRAPGGMCVLRRHPSHRAHGRRASAQFGGGPETP